MALLAEELVEEWLRRQGYFTMRGIKLGVHEIDLLAIRPGANGQPECRHLEVQASMRPVSYISRVPKHLQRAGRAANSAKRDAQELRQGVREWVETKFRRPDKRALMQALWPAPWSSELVLHRVKSEAEVEMIAAEGISILRLDEIIRSLSSKNFLIASASGADFVDLIQMNTAEAAP